MYIYQTNVFVDTHNKPVFKTIDKKYNRNLCMFH